MASDAPPFALRQSERTADAALCESGKGRMHIARTHVVFLTADAHVDGRVRDQLGLLRIHRYQRFGGGRQEAQVRLESLSPAPRDSEMHNATLLDDYILSGTGANSWCRDCGGAVVIR